MLVEVRQTGKSLSNSGRIALTSQEKECMANNLDEIETYSLLLKNRARSFSVGDAITPIFIDDHPRVMKATFPSPSKVICNLLFVCAIE